MTSDATTFEDAVTLVARELSLPPRFLARLRLEDDWSFVVKTHALAESALTHLLTTRLGKPAAALALARIGMSHKLKIVQSLEALPAKHLAGLQLLSEIRNGIVHDVRGASFTFEAYLADASKAGRFERVFGRDDLPEVYPDAETAAKVVHAHPKDSIWLLALDVLAHVTLDSGTALLEPLRRVLDPGEAQTAQTRRRR